MKQLKDLLLGVGEATQGRTDVEIKLGIALIQGSKSGDLFVAIQGDTVDGHHYIDKAIARAIAVIGEQNQSIFQKISF